MAWVDLASARGNEDYPLDAGVTVALHARISRMLQESACDLCYVADPPGAALNATTSTSAWAWLGHPLPVLARPKAGGAPRDVTIECQLRGSAADQWALRAYLLATRSPPGLDDTDAVLDSDAYVELARASTSYGYESGTITPDVSGGLYSDGYVVGFCQPVYWLHLCHKGTAAMTVYVRDIRLSESTT